MPLEKAMSDVLRVAALADRLFVPMDIDGREELARNILEEAQGFADSVEFANKVDAAKEAVYLIHSVLATCYKLEIPICAVWEAVQQNYMERNWSQPYQQVAHSKIAEVVNSKQPVLQNLAYQRGIIYKEGEK